LLAAVAALTVAGFAGLLVATRSEPSRKRVRDVGAVGSVDAVIS